MRRSSKASEAFPFRFETVAAETPGPQGISPTPSIRLVDAPARYISIMASSTLASRRRQRSMIAVVNLIPLSSGMRIATSPDVVASFRP